MHPSDPSKGAGTPSKTSTPDQSETPTGKRPRLAPGKVLWITLSALVVAAAAAAVVCFWYLPSRDSDKAAVTPSNTASTLAAGGASKNVTLLATQAADEEAKNLVRNAMAAIESAYAEASTYDPEVITPEVLARIAPAIAFNPCVAAAAPVESTAKAELSTVDYTGDELNFAVGTVSKTGTAFAVLATRRGDGMSWYFANGQETDWGTYVTTFPPPDGTTSPGSTPGLHEDSVLGCSFEYPTDWIVYEYHQVYGYLTDDPSVFIAGDPSTAPTPTPTDFIQFSGYRLPGQEAPSPREAAETFAADYERFRLEDGRQAAENAPGDGFFVEDEVNGIPTCSISYLTMKGTTAEGVPQYWNFLFLSSGDAAFTFQFVTTPTNAETNGVVFREVLESFRLTSPSE